MSDQQLVEQARDLCAKFAKTSDLAVEGGFVAARGFYEPRGHDYWRVSAIRSPRKAAPYEVVKAYTLDPDVAALLTFMSTALPRLCDLADAGLKALGAENDPR